LPTQEHCNEERAEMKLWFVDDKPANHATWLGSFPDDIQRSCELRSFLSLDELFAVLAGGVLPDILFLDFFVGERLGTEVIRWFDDRALRPVLIAHSSMEQANAGMVTAGADFSLEKIKNRPFTESIRQVFRNLEDVAFTVETRTARRGD
jgi:DNA-binding LytR/AlgR family response regulator